MSPHPRVGLPVEVAVEDASSEITLYDFKPA